MATSSRRRAMNWLAEYYDAPAGGGDPPVMTPFDPGEHTVAECQAYLAEHPDDADRVLAAEAEGKARVTLLHTEPEPADSQLSADPAPAEETAE